MSKDLGVWVASVLTVIWLCATTAFLYVHWCVAKAMPPNEWGDFLAGFFAPIAFVWLALGYWMQRRQIIGTFAAFEHEREVVNLERQHRADAQRSERLGKARVALAMLTAQMNDLGLYRLRLREAIAYKAKGVHEPRPPKWLLAPAVFHHFDESNRVELPSIDFLFETQEAEALTAWVIMANARHADRIAAADSLFETALKVQDTLSKSVHGDEHGLIQLGDMRNALGPALAIRLSFAVTDALETVSDNWLEVIQNAAKAIQRAILSLYPDARGFDDPFTFTRAEWTSAKLPALPLVFSMKREEAIF